MLGARKRASGGLPLVTFVDVDRRERSELSATSVENAAAKIANALRDEYALEPGAVVALDLPLHWQRTVWCGGVWTAGCVVVIDAHDPAAELVVTVVDRLEGPGQSADRPRIVVSLHPFGLPIEGALPAGVTDATIAVRQQPDAYLFEPPAPTSPALVRADGTLLSHDGLLALARERATEYGLGPGGRLLVRESTDPADDWLCALAVPLAANASTVMVSGGGADAVVAEQEGITARRR